MRVDVEEYRSPCSCGREHDVLVKGIVIASGAVGELERDLKEGPLSGYRNVVLVCDENTRRASEEIMRPVYQNSLVIELSPEGLHADNQHVDLLEGLVPEDADLLLAVGSGTVHDLTRYVSKQRQIPFVSVPTAPSVDGFVSTVAAMTWEGVKKTMPAQAPLYVYADTDIFGRAPERLIAAGVGDLLGKYVCLADWRIAHLLTGEYLCERVIALEEKALMEVKECLLGEGFGDAASLEKLMYALLLSGLAMQMVGNSRPASGAEHHLSHFWEMEVDNPHTDALHGEKVAVGTALMTSKYHALEKVLREGSFTASPWEKVREKKMAQVEAVFGRAGILPAIREENDPELLEGVDPEEIKMHADQIAKVLAQMPSKEEMDQLLTAGGCPKSTEDIGLSGEEAFVRESEELSPFVRRRLTLNRVSFLIDRL